MKTRKLFALVLTAMMLLALTLPAFAEGDTYSITISNTASGHTYEAYQIFKGDLSEQNGKKVLSNVEWGSGVDGDKLLAALKANETFGKDDANDFAKCTSAADVAEVLNAYANDAEKTQAFAKLAGANLKGSPANSTWNETEKKYTISDLTPGYYLVKDKDASLSGHDAYTRYILEVVGNVTVTAKVDVPTIDKKIVEGQQKVDANTANIGEAVNYEVTSKVPNMTGYTKYFFVMQDTLSKGLTYNDNIAVKVGNDTLSKGTNYTVTTKTNDDGTTSIEIVFKNFIQYKDRANTAIVVNYSATVNQDAELNPAVGNPNEVKLIYSNNPNVEGKGEEGDEDKPGTGDATGETPVAKTQTYVTGLKLKKIDGTTKAALTGAKFQIAGQSMKVVLINETMYKASESGIYYMLKNGTYTTNEPQTNKENEGYNADDYDSTTQKYEKVEVVNKDTVASQINATGYVDENGELTFEGLGEGTYTITEIIAPAGYNLLNDPITVVITAGEALTGCTWTVKIGDKTLSAGDDYLYVFEVENKSGSTLPSTGGMGTTMFYVLGALLAVGAGVLLATRKKMSGESR